MSNHAKQKGYRGERQVLQLLQQIVNEEHNALKTCAPELSRSPNGKDIVGLRWIAVEVKYREAIDANQWWNQTKINAPQGAEPVLIWRSNWQPWRVRMFCYLDASRGGQSGRPRVRCPADISIEAFQVWFRQRLREEIRTELAQADGESRATRAGV